MITQTTHASSSMVQWSLPTDYTKPRWYAAYTRAQHEKQVALQLDERNVEHYLPLYEVVRQWKDRCKRVRMPLFPGYVFVRIPLLNRLDVLRIPGVVHLVGFNGSPTALDDEEVESLRCALAQGVGAQPHPFLTIGRRVRITTGPLAGLNGILLRQKKSSRLVVSLDLIQRSVAVDIDAGDLEPAIG